MTIKDVVNYIPDEMMKYVDSISYVEGDSGSFSLDLSIKTEEYSFVCNLNLFSDGTAGVYELRAYDLETYDEVHDYIDSEVIFVIYKFISLWEKFLCIVSERG